MALLSTGLELLSKFPPGPYLSAARPLLPALTTTSKPAAWALSSASASAQSPVFGGGFTGGDGTEIELPIKMMPRVLLACCLSYTQPTPAIKSDWYPSGTLQMGVLSQ